MLFEKSQTDLRALAEDLAKSTSRAPGSDAQKIGDFYQSFLDEARVEQLGLTPLTAQLAEIDALKTKTDLARYFARAFKMNLTNPVVGFVDGDAGDPTREILYLFQGGLGMPDRDYYLKDEAAADAVPRPVPRVPDHGAQDGRPAVARGSGQRHLRARAPHRPGPLDQRREPRRGEDLQQGRVADLPKQFPGFDWAAYTTELGIAGAPAVVVSQPSYFKAFAAMANEMPVDRLEAVPQGVAHQRLRART